jgi:hypothetical protein
MYVFICNNRSLNAEIQHLGETFRQDGYSKTDFNRAMHHKSETTTQNEKPTDVVNLPFQHTAAYKISRLLSKFNI